MDTTPVFRGSGLLRCEFFSRNFVGQDIAEVLLLIFYDVEERQQKVLILLFPSVNNSLIDIKFF